jgi:hypothetical protein
VSLGELTDATVRYLYATTWLPEAGNDWSVAVPGGSTRAVDTAANLLHIAMWSLRDQGLMEFEQLRPVEEERVRVLGGPPFAAFKLQDASAARSGLDGALLRAAGKADGDVRSLVRALDLDNRSPWNTVTSHCFAEASAAALVGVKGRLFKNVVITDVAAVESLRGRNDELRTARGAYLDAEPELTLAVMSDCLRTVADAYSPDLGD